MNDLEMLSMTFASIGVKYTVEKSSLSHMWRYNIPEDDSNRIAKTLAVGDAVFFFAPDGSLIGYVAGGDKETTYAHRTDYTGAASRTSDVPRYSWAGKRDEGLRAVCGA